MNRARTEQEIKKGENMLSAVNKTKEKKIKVEMNLICIRF